MKIIDVQQNSPEWFFARLGIPTASNFDKIVDTKGQPSKQKTKYMNKLAGEKVSGLQEETYTNGIMQRGIEMEDEARKLYELQADKEVKQVGLCVSEGNIIYGASPDGLIGSDGLLEIKCPLIATHVSYLLENKLPTDYYQQTQGQLLVTGRKWVDFMSYYPGIKPFIVRVKPDKAFQEALKRELTIFCAELAQVVERIK